MNFDQIQAHIRKRMALALGGEARNALRERAGLKHSTFTDQWNGLRPVTLETLVAVANALKRPLGFFLPEELLGVPERDILAEEAFYRMAEVVDWAREEAAESEEVTPPEIALAKTLLDKRSKLPNSKRALSRPHKPRPRSSSPRSGTDAASGPESPRSPREGDNG